MRKKVLHNNLTEKDRPQGAFELQTTLCGWCNKEILKTEIENHLASEEHKENKKRKESIPCH